MTPQSPGSPSERQTRAHETFERIVGSWHGAVVDTDPEFMDILRGFVFGDVFNTGDLDDQTRELITVTVLTCLQCDAQVSVHTSAALHVGTPPVAIREAVYQLAPFIGIPRVLNAITAMNAAFTDAGIELPLPAQGTVTDETRYDAGLAIQDPLYGNEIKNDLATLPAPFDEALPRFLTEFGFGDFYTRTGLTVAQRELLVLCALATIGDTSAQLPPHARACLQLGWTKADLVAALVHCFGYVGFPRAVAAIRVVRDL